MRSVSSKFIPIVMVAFFAMSLLMVPMAMAETTASFSVTTVPDTGQTTMYSTVFGEDSDYNYDFYYSIGNLINQPSYKVMPSTTYPDTKFITVRDDVTGLLWQQQDDGVARTWSQAFLYCSNLSHIGTNGWRLPTLRELQNLKYYEGEVGDPRVPVNPSDGTAVFTFSPGSDPYWTATSLAGDSTRAWQTYFDSSADSTQLKTVTGRSLCVKGLKYPSADYTDYFPMEYFYSEVGVPVASYVPGILNTQDSQRELDNNTGLMWQSGGQWDAPTITNDAGTYFDPADNGLGVQITGNQISPDSISVADMDSAIQYCENLVTYIQTWTTTMTSRTTRAVTTSVSGCTDPAGNVPASTVTTTADPTSPVVLYAFSYGNTMQAPIPSLIGPFTYYHTTRISNPPTSTFDATSGCTTTVTEVVTIAETRTQTETYTRKHVDWRLPNVKELFSIIDSSKSSPSADISIFPGANAENYWTSTSNFDDAAQATVWQVDYDSGRVVAGAREATSARVRCVRGPDDVVDAPTATIVSAAADTLLPGYPTPIPAVSTVSPIPVEVHFNKVVTGLTISELAITNGTASRFSCTSDTMTHCTFNVTPSAPGYVTIGVGARVAQDAVTGVGNQAAILVSTYYIDSVAPTVSITTTAPITTNTSPIPVTITFSEQVMGFVIGDIVVSNGVASNFVELVPGLIYTIDVTPIAPGVVSINIPAGAAKDLGGNDNKAAVELSRNYQVAPAEVVISSAASNPTKVSPIPVTITFSTPVTGFVIGDVVVGNGTKSNFSGSGTTYTLDVTPTAQGLVTVDVAAGVALNGAVPFPTTPAVQLSRTYDSFAPTVGITTTALAGWPKATPLPIVITFSEPVTGFLAGAITVGNGTAANFTGSGTTYTADITPGAGPTVTVNIGAGVAQDVAGNSNTVAPQFSWTYAAVADITPPMANNVTPYGNYASTGTGQYVSGTFNLSTDFIDGETAVTSCEYYLNGVWSPAVVSGTGPQYTCTKTGITGTNSSSLTLNMRATSGGGTTAAMAITVVVDTVAPVTTASAASGPLVLTPADAGSGVATTMYCFDTTNTCTPSIAGTTVVVSCPDGVGPCSLSVRYYSADRVGNSEAVQSTSVAFPLNVSKAGSDADKVVSSTGGISCGSSCAANFAPFQQLTLTAEPAPDSLFLSWSGNCAGNSPSCNILMNEGKNVSANFDSCFNPTVYAGGNYYNSILTAYNWGGNGSELELRAAPEYTLSSSIFTQANAKVITLTGGLNCDFSPGGGMSTIVGPLTVSGGTLTMDGIIIK